MIIYAPDSVEEIMSETLNQVDSMKTENVCVTEKSDNDGIWAMIFFFQFLLTFFIFPLIASPSRFTINRVKH